MNVINIILNPKEVNDYLIEHGLEEGFVPVEAALLQTGERDIYALLIVEVEGAKRLVKMRLSALEAITGALHGAVEARRALVPKGQN